MTECTRPVLSISLVLTISGCAPVPVALESQVVEHLPSEVAIGYLRNLEPVYKNRRYAKRTQCQYTDTSVKRIGGRPVPFQEEKASPREMVIANSSFFEIFLEQSGCWAYRHEVFPSNNPERNDVVKEVSKAINALASLGVTINK